MLAINMVNDFAEWLAERMKQANLNQSELARLVGVNSAVISRILDRKASPSPNTLLGFSKVFKLPPEQVLRVAGLLPRQSQTDQLIEEGIYILKQLEGEDKEEALRFLRLRREVQEERKNVGKRKERATRA